ncbi:MAG: hypothetical protein HY901_19110 [Deltaproteobacteria bacterium]|nr:hypothetical protein [Deltaproteobacteria bacterium]
MKLLAMGKRADALAVFERASRFLVCSGATRYNAALCLLLLGKQEDAQRRFDKLSKSWVLSKNVPLAAAAAHLASVSASLSGDEPKARALFDQANKIKAETPVASVSELMLLARAGNHGGVVKLAETRWQALESCGWILRKAARLVQAYAAQQIGQPEAAITEIIAGAKPFAAGDFDFLSAQWPEMKAFLETRTAPSPSAQSAAS